VATIFSTTISSDNVTAAASNVAALVEESSSRRMRPQLLVAKHPAARARSALQRRRRHGDGLEISRRDNIARIFNADLRPASPCALAHHTQLSHEISGVADENGA